MSSEIVLVGMAMFIYVVGAFEPKAKIWPWIATISYLVTLIVVPRYEASLFNKFLEQSVTLSGPLAVDHLGQFVRLLALIVGLLFTLAMWKSSELSSERLGTLMLAIVGIMIVGRANELALLFVGLELVSVPTYVLLFLGRKDRATAEATVKYFFLSILSSGLLLYGLSFLYGVTGTTSLTGTTAQPGIREILANASAASIENGAPLATIALVLIFAALGFKIAAVPFHFYAPDVYQGTTNANAGLLAIAPKIAGIAALIRLVTLLPGITGSFAWQLALILAILTMTLGNICALWQKNVRRLLAYSSVAHAGYMLIGIAVALAGGDGGISSTLFYVVVYSFGSLGTFAALTYLESDERPLNSLEDLTGLSQSRPLVAGVIAACMFSFSGIPIFAGFWGKFGLFMSAVNLASSSSEPVVTKWFMVLAITGALNAAIAAAYYLRVIAMMFFQPARNPVPAQGGLPSLIASVICGLAVVGLGISWNPVMQRAKVAEKGISHQQTVATPAATKDSLAAQ